MTTSSSLGRSSLHCTQTAFTALSPYYNTRSRALFYHTQSQQHSLHTLSCALFYHNQSQQHSLLATSPLHYLKLLAAICLTAFITLTADSHCIAATFYVQQLALIHTAIKYSNRPTTGWKRKHISKRSHDSFQPTHWICNILDGCKQGPVAGNLGGAPLFTWHIVSRKDGSYHMNTTWDDGVLEWHWRTARVFEEDGYGHGWIGILEWNHAAALLRSWMKMLKPAAPKNRMTQLHTFLMTLMWFAPYLIQFSNVFIYLINDHTFVPCSLSSIEWVPIIFRRISYHQLTSTRCGSLGWVLDRKGNRKFENWKARLNHLHHGIEMLMNPLL